MVVHLYAREWWSYLFVEAKPWPLSPARTGASRLMCEWASTTNSGAWSAASLASVIRTSCCRCSAFLSRHVDVDNGAKRCAEAQLWRSAALLAQRHRADQPEVLRVLIQNGPKYWSDAVPSMRSLVRVVVIDGFNWKEASVLESLPFLTGCCL